MSACWGSESFWGFTFLLHSQTLMREEVMLVVMFTSACGEGTCWHIANSFELGQHLNTALPLPLALSKPAFAWGELWNEPPAKHLWAALLPEKRQKGFNKERPLGIPTPCSQKMGYTHDKGNNNTNIRTTNVNKSVKRWEVDGFVR